MQQTLSAIIAVIGVVVLLFGAWKLYRDNDALRDESVVSPKPYSFARAQLWWWTIIILGSFIGVYGVTGAFWPLNKTCLILLGISVVTTTAGRLVDNQQISNPNVERHQDRSVSQGFFVDIMSDEYGLSVHRFQAVVFNLVYGLSFLIQVFTSLKEFPSYDDSTLALLGVSSAAYVALKMNENAPSTTAVPAKRAAAASGIESDELLDVGAVDGQQDDN